MEKGEHKLKNEMELFDKMRNVMKLYDMLCQQVCGEYGITRTELDVLAFLKNHPGMDTARDIVEIRMLPKANVSQAVESLIQKNYLTRSMDEQDRRRIHLTITDQAADAVQAIRSMQSEYQKIRFQGFSKEERSRYEEMVRRIYENAKNEIERMR